MAFHYASDMTLDELDHFIRNHRESMRLSPADEIAMHLRRQRRAYLFGRERPALKFVRRPLRILLLGDETDAKLRLAALLQGDADGSINPLLELGTGDEDCEACDDNDDDRNDHDGGAMGALCAADGTESAFPRVEVFVPSTSDATASLRGELCIACDVIVMCFDADASGSGSNRGSGNGLQSALDAMRQRWWKAEAAPAFATLAKDSQDAKDLKDLRSSKDFKDSKAAWPVAPVIVTGLSCGALAVPAAHSDALRLAQEMGASKYMELRAGSPRHAQALVTQCSRLAAAVANALEPGTAEFIAAAKSSALRLHLRVPVPRAAVDTMARQLRVCVTPGITCNVTVDGSDPRKALFITHNSNHDRHSNLNHGHSYSSGRMVVPADGVIDLRPLRLSPGAVLRLSGHARCAYASTVINLSLPSATQAPAAYIDVALRRFTIIPRDVPLSLCDVRYTLDGSAPTRRSAAYTQPIDLDSTETEMCEPWRPWRSACPPPRVVRISAFTEDTFPSTVVSYTVPALLETPRIVYTAQGSTFSLDIPTASPLVEYRYTLDGTTPTMASPLYTGPVSLSATATRQIRVVAFPVLFFPSREAIFCVPTAAAQKQEDPASSAFHTTRASMMRGEHVAQKLRSLSLNNERTKVQQGGEKQSSRVERAMNGATSPLPQSLLLSSSSLRTGTPRLQTELRAAASRHRCRLRCNESIASGGNDEHEPKSSATTPRGTLSARSKGHAFGSSSPPPSPSSSKVRSSRAASTHHKKNFEHSNKVALRNMEITKKNDDTKWNVNELYEESDDSLSEIPLGARCTADNNTVVFDFPESISLAYITVTTPGGGAGPSSYDVEAKHAHGSDFMAVGSGELRDISGVQTLKVLLSARLFPIDRVRCVFSGGSPGNKTTEGFRVKNIRVHGRPFTGH